MTALRAWTSARWTIPLPPGHRFPAEKYGLVRDGIVARGLLPAAAILEPAPAARDDLALVHADAWLDGMLEGTLSAAAQRRLGFPWSPALRERSLRTAQGTLEAARDALAQGAGINLAGGTHHAFADRGEGYCCFNDVALAVRVLRRERGLGRVAVVDLDVHQGNGTARLFASDPATYTFSMQGAGNYPFVRERSDRDVELPDGTGDAAYLAALDRHLDAALDAAAPTVVFYLAGADPYMHDRLGRLALSRDGLRARDRRVVRACRRRGLPLVLTLAGGYAADLTDLVAIHAATVDEVCRAYG